MMAGFERKDTIYQNSLSSEADLDGFVMEGKGVASFPLARMRLENFTEPTDDNHGNFVLFCPEEFPSDVAISWDFWPVREPGLSIMFFAAQGRGGEDILESELLGRSGDYRHLVFQTSLAWRARTTHLQSSQIPRFSSGLPGCRSDPSGARLSGPLPH